MPNFLTVVPFYIFIFDLKMHFFLLFTVIHLWTPITKGKRGWGKGKRERERDGQETPKWNEKHFCPFDSLLLCHTEITFFAVKSVVAVEKRERKKKSTTA